MGKFYFTDTNLSTHALHHLLMVYSDNRVL